MLSLSKLQAAKKLVYARFFLSEWPSARLLLWPLPAWSNARWHKIESHSVASKRPHSAQHIAMTIQVHPEVFLQLSSQHHGESSSKALQGPYSWPISPSKATVLKEPFREDLLSDDDTLSTTSLSDTSSDCGSEVLDRTVSFAEELVTEVHTRPFTPPDQVPELYYSQEETSRYVGNITI